MHRLVKRYSQDEEEESPRNDYSRLLHRAARDLREGETGKQKKPKTSFSRPSSAPPRNRRYKGNNSPIFHAFYVSNKLLNLAYITAGFTICVYVSLSMFVFHVEFVFQMSKAK